MGLTQKYKQQQRQVRVHTNESNYISGMYYTDAPLAEGYSKTLVNFDIDSLSGKLTPRKGLQSLGFVKANPNSTRYLNNTNGFNIINQSKVCAASDSVDPRKINKLLQSVLYNTDTRSLAIATCKPEIDTTEDFDVIPFTLNKAEEFVTPEPFIIAEPEIHNKKCKHNNFFKKPVGTFAFGNSYYTFLKRNKYSVHKIADLPDATLYPNINTYADLVASETLNKGTPATYFKFVSGDSAGIIAYYDKAGIINVWERSEEALILEVFPTTESEHILCYTKLGSEIQPDEVLLDSTVKHSELNKDIYYTCVATPDKINPTEAASWGYNMLLENPYDFVCEETAANTISILGMLPYDKEGNLPVLTPRKNQEITLKGFYRAPKTYHSDTKNAKFYATTKQRVTVTVDDKTETRDPKNLDELKRLVNVNNFKYGDWWYCSEEEKYYMVQPFFTEGSTTAIKEIRLFGDSKPAASEKLAATNKSEESEVRVRWQIRHSGASDWIDIYNEVQTLTEYYAANGGYKEDGHNAPFTVTTTMPANEVLVKLTISDPEDVDDVVGEEYVLATNTIGLSLVSDELANTLNLNAKIFDLGQCTGMCEWEQRLVLWGVPGALNTIFISDVNNPTFFPYPNNVDIFTDPIIAVHNYGDELLVLTTSALYRLTWDSEGTGWTHKLVQQNLHITEEDTYMSCVIKNMFFFKSGEYYYMMVPKANSASVRGEVAIAPISKPIADLLDNFHEEIYGLVKVMTDQYNLADFTEQLVNYFSYVDNTKVVVNYVYDLNWTIGETESFSDSKYLYVQLIYDTDARTWSMRIFEAAHMLYASHADAIQQDRFIDITPAFDGTVLALQYYKFINQADDTMQYITEDGTAVAVNRLIKNYQYLDTGNREINTEMKKRFREFQFKIKNSTATNLGFYTSFLVDGSLRKDLQRYSPRFLLDESSGESIIVVEKTLETNTDYISFVPAYVTTRIERVLVPERMLQDSGELTPTILADTEADPDRWVLDQSAFPGRTLWKIRMPVSGKGFSPRAILLSTNEAQYEILGHSWVYRTMNGR